MNVRFSPITTRGILKRIAVPEHMQQGDSVDTSVSEGQSRLRPARRMQSTSACAVGSPDCTRWLCPAATTLPRASSSELPMGIPPSRQPFSAISIAASRPREIQSLSIMVTPWSILQMVDGQRRKFTRVVRPAQAAACFRRSSTSAEHRARAALGCKRSGLPRTRHFFRCPKHHAESPLAPRAP